MMHDPKTCSYCRKPTGPMPVHKPRAYCPSCGHESVGHVRTASSPDTPICVTGGSCSCTALQVRPDPHAGQMDPITRVRATETCRDCGQSFTPYYYRMHRGPSYQERCSSLEEE